MANLSVPSPGKWISDMFGKHSFWLLFVGIQISVIFRKKGPQVAPQAKVPLQKASYIDPLVMMDSPEFEFFVDILHQTLRFCFILGIRRPCM